jgi:tRNA(Ile)-lysidine synthase
MTDQPAQHFAGQRATQAGVIASPRAGIWRFRPAPPRRTA